MTSTVCFINAINIVRACLEMNINGEHAIITPNTYQTLSPTTSLTQLVQKLVLQSCYDNKAETANPITNYTPIILHLLACNFYLLECNKAYKVYIVYSI